MPPRMIQVRSKATGEIALVNERAFGYFAADYERVDTPSADAPAPAPVSPAAPPQSPTSKPTDRRTPAAKGDEPDQK